MNTEQAELFNKIILAMEAQLRIARTAKGDQYQRAAGKVDAYSAVLASLYQNDRALNSDREARL